MLGKLFWPRLVYYWPVLGNFHNFSQTLNFFSNISETLKVHSFPFFKLLKSGLVGICPYLTGIKCSLGVCRLLDKLKTYYSWEYLPCKNVQANI